VLQVSGGVSVSLLVSAAVDLEQVRHCVRGALVELGLPDPSVSAQSYPTCTGTRRPVSADGSSRPDPTVVSRLGPLAAVGPSCGGRAVLRRLGCSAAG
jgi:hypothetical protein